MRGGDTGARVQRASSTSQRRRRSSTNRSLTDDNYYSAMAAARLKRTIEPHPKPLALDAKLFTTIEERFLRSERARELFLCGMRPEAL